MGYVDCAIKLSWWQ